MADMSRRKVTYGDKFHLHTVSPFAKTTVEKLGGYLGVLFQNAGLSPVFCAPPIQSPYDGLFQTCYFRIVDPHDPDGSLSKDVRFGDAFVLEAFTQDNKPLTGVFNDISPSSLNDTTFIFTNPVNSTEPVYYNSPNVTINIVQSFLKTKPVKSASIRPLPLNLARGVNTTITAGYLTSLQPRSNRGSMGTISTSLELRDTTSSIDHDTNVTPSNNTSITPTSTSTEDDDNNDLGYDVMDTNDDAACLLPSSIFQLHAIRFELRPYGSYTPFISMSLLTVNTPANASAGNVYRLPSPDSIVKAPTVVTHSPPTPTLLSSITTPTLYDIKPVGPTIQPLPTPNIPLSGASNVKFHGQPIHFPHFEGQQSKFLYAGDLPTHTKPTPDTTAATDGKSNKNTPNQQKSSTDNAAKNQPNALYLSIRDLGEIVLPITSLSSPNVNLAYSAIAPPSYHAGSAEFTDFDLYRATYTHYPLHKHPKYHHLYVNPSQSPSSPTTSLFSIAPTLTTAPSIIPGNVASDRLSIGSTVAPTVFLAGQPIGLNTSTTLSPIPSQSASPKVDSPTDSSDTSNQPHNPHLHSGEYTVQPVSSTEQVHPDGHSTLVTTYYNNGQKIYSTRVNVALMGTRVGNRIVLPVTFTCMAIPPQYEPFCPIKHGKEQQSHPQFSDYPIQYLGAPFTTSLAVLLLSFVTNYCMNDLYYQYQYHTSQLAAYATTTASAVVDDVLLASADNVTSTPPSMLAFYINMMRVILPTVITALVLLFYPFLFGRKRYNMSFRKGLTDNVLWHASIEKPYGNIDYSRLLTNMGIHRPRQLTLDHNTIELVQILEGIANSALLTDGSSLLNPYRFSALFYMAPKEQERVLLKQSVLEQLERIRHRQLTRKLALHHQHQQHKHILANEHNISPINDGENISDIVPIAQHQHTQNGNAGDTPSAMIVLNDEEVNQFSLLTEQEMTERHQLLTELISTKLDEVTYSILSLDSVRPDPVTINRAHHKHVSKTPLQTPVKSSGSKPNASSPSVAASPSTASTINPSSPSRIPAPQVPPSVQTALTKGGMTVKAYYPYLFHAIRESHNITPADYAQAWTFLLDNLPEMDLGAGRSGSLFMRSSCNSFIFKTLSKDDMKTLHLVIQDYTEYVIANPSLLMRFFGVYRFTFTHPHTLNKDSIYVLIGDNIFNIPSSIPYHHLYSLASKYDLKGRKPKKDPEKRLQTAHRNVYKDNQVSRSFSLHETIHRHIITTLGNDVDWLKEHDCIDYSLLVGVVEISPHIPIPPPLPNNPAQHRQIGIPPYVRASCDQEFFKIGIVDFLARYSTFKKKTAHFFKSKLWEDEELSTVNAPFYGERLKDYSHVAFPEPGAITVRTYAQLVKALLDIEVDEHTEIHDHIDMKTAVISSSNRKNKFVLTAQDANGNTIVLPKEALDALSDTARSAGTIITAPNGRRIVILPRGVANAPQSIAERSKLYNGNEASLLDSHRRRSALLSIEPSMLYPTLSQANSSNYAEESVLETPFAAAM